MEGGWYSGRVYGEKDICIGPRQTARISIGKEGQHGIPNTEDLNRMSKQSRVKVQGLLSACEECCGLAHSHIKIPIPGRELGLSFVGNGEPPQASVQGVCALHLRRSQCRTLCAQWSMDPTEMRVPAVSQEHGTGIDGSLTYFTRVLDHHLQLLWPFLMAPLLGPPYLFYIYTMENVRELVFRSLLFFIKLILVDLMHTFNTVIFYDYQIHLCSPDLQPQL